MKNNRDGKSLLIGSGFIATSLELKGTAPSELLLFPFGEWNGYANHGGKPVTISMTPRKAQLAKEYFLTQRERNPEKQLVIDYEHQTLSGGEAPAAAWISGLDIRDQGLFGTGIEWTNNGRKRVEEKEYKYYSPWWFDAEVAKQMPVPPPPFYDHKTGKPVEFVFKGAGLTNNPFIDEIPHLTSRDGSQHLYLFSSQISQQEDSMDPQLLALLIGFFSLAATAKPDELVAKVNWLTEQLKAAGIVAKEGTVMTAQSVIDQIKAVFAEAHTFKANYAAVATALGAVGTDPVEKLTAMIASAKDKTGFVARAEFDTLQTKFNEREVDELIASAMSKGKISPATKDHFKKLAVKDRQSFVDLMAATAEYSVVPLQEIKTPATVPATAGVSETDLLVAKQLNVSKDQLAKVTAN